MDGWIRMCGGRRREDGREVDGLAMLEGFQEEEESSGVIFVCVRVSGFGVVDGLRGHDFPYVERETDRESSPRRS